MTVELLNTIREYWKAAGEPTDEAGIVEVLISSGVSGDDGDRAAATAFLDDEAVALETGADPIHLTYRAIAERDRRLSEQRKRERADHVRGEIERVRDIVEEVAGRPDTGVEDLRVPVEKLGTIADGIREAYAPSRVDAAALLTPRKWDDIIERIRSKPEALETSYVFPDGEDGEPLRFQTGSLSIVAAPTGHGKTTFLINLLLDAVKRYPDKRHWLFSYEEDAVAVTVKALNTWANLSLSKNNRRSIESYLRTGSNEYFGNYNDPATGRPQFEKLPDLKREFLEGIETGRINIVEAEYPAEHLLTAIRTISGDRAGFVGIDYLGLLSREDRDRSTTRQEELKRIALDLKNVAIETGLPIVAAAQFNREVVSAGRMAPHRIAEASDIERAANKIIGIWNGDKHAEPDKGEKAPEEYGIERGTVLLRILKARDERSDLDGVFGYNGNQGTIEYQGDPLRRPPPRRSGNGKRNGTDSDTIESRDLI